jgi:NAD(P)-dependent dehydrogenase (short-subunit alcohol dehydrogenase family)
MQLKEMTVVITGAAGGIGQALSQGFLNDGAKLVAVDRNGEGLKSLAARGAKTANVDVSDPVQVQGMVDLALKEFGRLDVLINNAAVGFKTLISDDDPDQFEGVIRINLFGPYYGLRAAMRVMRHQRFGRIINLLSRAAEGSGPGLYAYGCSKAALFALTRYAAREVGPEEDILINGLIPGITKTGMMPEGQDPSVVYPTARMLATLPAGGPTGRVFWDQKEYFLFQPENEVFKR